MISTKHYKLFFITVLIAGGFLFLANTNQASATCICNDSDWDYSGVALQSQCDSMCSSYGGVRTFSEPVRQACAICCCNDGNSVPGADCMVSCEDAGGLQSEGASYWCGETVPAAPTCNAVEEDDEEECDPACDADETCVSGTCEVDEEDEEDTTEEDCIAACNGDGGCEAGCLSLGDEEDDEEECDPETEDCEEDDGTTTGDGEDGGTTTGGGTTRTAGPSVGMPNFSGIRSVQDLFSKIIAFIMPLALLFAGVMIIWSGFLFVTAQGDPTAITKAKQNFIWTITGVAIVLSSGAIVDYVSGLLGGTSTGSGQALRSKIETILRDQIIPVLFLLVTVYFFWGIITYVRAGGDEKAIDTGKKHMLWGIIGMAIMASAWGIVGVISSMVR